MPANERGSYRSGTTENRRWFVFSGVGNLRRWKRHGIGRVQQCMRATPWEQYNITRLKRALVARPVPKPAPALHNDVEVGKAAALNIKPPGLPKVGTEIHCPA